MKKFFVIIMMMAIIFLGVSSDVFAGKQRGIHFNEAKAKRDAETWKERSLKVKEKWEIKKAAWKANRDEWRDNLDEFKEGISSREKIKARRNKSSHQKIDYNPVLNN